MAPGRASTPQRRTYINWRVRDHGDTSLEAIRQWTPKSRAARTALLRSARAANIAAGLGPEGTPAVPVVPIAPVHAAGPAVGGNTAGVNALGGNAPGGNAAVGNAPVGNAAVGNAPGGNAAGVNAPVGNAAGAAALGQQAQAAANGEAVNADEADDDQAQGPVDTDRGGDSPMANDQPGDDATGAAGNAEPQAGGGEEPVRQPASNLEGVGAPNIDTTQTEQDSGSPSADSESDHSAGEYKLELFLIATNTEDEEAEREKDLDSRRRLAIRQPAEFPDTLGNNDGEWAPRPVEIGTGSYGIANLWIKIRDCNIVDRIVTKDNFVSRSDWLQWINWFGDPKKPAEREHMEIHIMRLLTEGDRPGSSKCVQYRAHQVSDQDRYFRIYIGFCPRGNLSELVGDIRKSDLQVLPEPAIWSLFSDLVEAFLLLEYGDASAKSIGHREWQPIVHRDIKMDNVFLDDPDSSPGFPSYPKARLADFGLAVMTDITDLNNPMAYNHGAGTPGWKAPEQVRWVSIDDITHQWRNTNKLLASTNVWGIGALIIRTMNADPYDRVHDEHPTFDTPHKAHPVLNAIGMDKNLYSDALRKLARQCTSYSPGKRPTLLKLKRKIAKYTTPGTPDDKARGLRTNMMPPPDDLRPATLPLRHDQYRVGMVAL